MLKETIKKLIKTRVKIGLMYATQKEIAQNTLMTEFYQAIDFNGEDDAEKKESAIKLKIEQLKDKNRVNKNYIKFLCR